MTASLIREFNVSGQSTGTFGRVLCSARHHHFVVDGPVQNGCPGEALTPPEAFLASIAACGVELAQVIAKEDAIPIGDITAAVFARVDRGNPVRGDFTVFNELRVSFTIAGVTIADGTTIVEKFTKR